MHREIKFRAWCKLEAKMGPSFSIQEVLDGDSPDYLYHGEEDVVMQFTGLKDKNEKEIYEGDILLYPDTESEHVDVGIGMMKVAEYQINQFWPVEYCDGEFGMNIKDGELIYGASERNPEWISLKRFFEDYIGANKCEIIGNIYENADFIGDKN